MLWSVVISSSLHIKDDSITYVCAWVDDSSICIYGDSSKWVYQEIISGEKSVHGFILCSIL